MYNFLKIQYQLGKITEAQFDTAVTKGYITEEQKLQILT